MRSDRFDMLDAQREVRHVTHALWPTESVQRAALALAEEVGEVCRAIVKRDEADAAEGDRRGDNWTGNLRRELAQVVIVCMNMAAMEGFNLAAEIEDEIIVLGRRLRAIESHEPECVE